MSTDKTNDPNGNEMVRGEQLVKRFGEQTVLNGVDLSVERGQAVVIIGPSGSGKTTLLRWLNHLEKIEGGRLYIDGQLLGSPDPGEGMVEERGANFPGGRPAIGF